MDFNKNYDYSEFYKLVVTLIVRGYTVEVINVYDGKQVNVYSQKSSLSLEKELLWDANIHYQSYGHEVGKLETYGTIVENFTHEDTVMGYLTADEILKYCPIINEALF